MRNNPTGAMGLRDHLGHGFVSRRGAPLINLPGCPVQPDAITETLQRIALEIAGVSPPTELDDQGRPLWLFEQTAHETCDRAGLAEHGRFAETLADHGSCLAKVGCSGPVAKCNVPARGWVNGVGGCPNVGGICIACTMPGFPDHFLPFMDSSPLTRLSTGGGRFLYGRSCDACATTRCASWSAPAPDVNLQRARSRFFAKRRAPPLRCQHPEDSSASGCRHDERLGMTTISTQYGHDTTAAEVARGIDLTGRRIIVTGGASGIGVETARALAAHRSRRDARGPRPRRRRAHGREIAETTGNAECTSRSSTSRTAPRSRAFVAAWTGPLHVLVNNAGVMACPETRTPEGWELQFATNHLGHFALAPACATRWRPPAPARIVAVSSSAHRRSPVVFDDIHFERRAYDPWLAYGQSKTANVLFAVEAARRWADDGITANALMPGVIATNLQRHMDEETRAQLRGAGGSRRSSMKTPGAGRRHLGAARGVPPRWRASSGRYFEDCNEAARDERHGGAARASPLRARSRGRAAPMGGLAADARDSGRALSQSERLTKRREGVAATLALREAHGLESDRRLARAPDADEAPPVLLAEDNEPAVVRPGDARALERHVGGRTRHVRQPSRDGVEHPDVKHLIAREMVRGSAKGSAT